MKTAQAARRLGARGLVVGAAAAVVALGAGPPAAAQPAEFPTYECQDGAGGLGVAVGVRCQALNGAPEQGVVQGHVVITLPSSTWTCHFGMAVMPVTITGYDCT